MIPHLTTEEETDVYAESEQCSDLIAQTFRALMTQARASLRVDRSAPTGSHMMRQHMMIQAAARLLGVVCCLGPENDDSALILPADSVRELLPSVMSAVAQETANFLKFAEEKGLEQGPEPTVIH